MSELKTIAKESFAVQEFLMIYDYVASEMNLACSFGRDTLQNSSCSRSGATIPDGCQSHFYHSLFADIDHSNGLPYTCSM